MNCLKYIETLIEAVTMSFDDRIGLACFGSIFLLYSSQPSSARGQTPYLVDNKHKKFQRWYVNLGGAWSDMNSGMPAYVMSVDGAYHRSAGGSGTVTNAGNVLLDVGYFFAPHFAISALAGVPAKSDLIGTGTLAHYPVIGRARYGLPTVTVHYHFDLTPKNHSYIDGGASDAFLFQREAGFIHHLKIADSRGEVLQAGSDFDRSEDWGMCILTSRSFGVTSTPKGTGQAISAVHPQKLQFISRPICSHGECTTGGRSDAQLGYSL